MMSSERDDDLPEGLRDVHDHLVRELEASQGPWRNRPLALQLAIVGVPAAVVVVGALVVLPALRGVTASVVVALLSAAVALVGAALAPARPGLGERLSQLAVVVGAVAFGVELLPLGGPHGDLGMPCLGLTATVSALASGLVFAGLAASRAPLRSWHRVGLITAGVLGGCVAVWHHCAATTLRHIAVSHVLGPAALLVGAVALSAWVSGRR